MKQKSSNMIICPNSTDLPYQDVPVKNINTDLRKIRRVQKKRIRSKAKIKPKKRTFKRPKNKRTVRKKKRVKRKKKKGNQQEKIANKRNKKSKSFRLANVYVV